MCMYAQPCTGVYLCRTSDRFAHSAMQRPVTCLAVYVAVMGRLAPTTAVCACMRVKTRSVEGRGGVSWCVCIWLDAGGDQ